MDFSHPRDTDDNNKFAVIYNTYMRILLLNCTFPRNYELVHEWTNVEVIIEEYVLYEEKIFQKN